MTTAAGGSAAACPACGQAGDRIVYGLVAGPPGPNERLGGCLIAPDNPDYACPSCRTTWQVNPLRVLNQGTPGMERVAEIAMSISLCVTVIPAFGEALEFRSTGLHEEYLETINGYTGELIVERVEYGPRGTDEWARLGTAVVAAWDTTSWRSVTRHNPVAQPSELPATQEAQ